MAQVERAHSTFAGRSVGFDTRATSKLFPVGSVNDSGVDVEDIDWSMDWEDSQKQKRISKPKKSTVKTASTGLKKKSLKQSVEKDMPPTPFGHEWRETEGGWNLIRCWSERDSLLGKKIKKERYAGHLSRQAWQVIKEYEYEKIISQIGQQLRRHSGR